MNDTPQSVLELWQRDIESLPPEDRLRMACSMFEFSRDLVADSIRNEGENLSDLEIARRVFVRFHADDFDSVTLEKIAAMLE